MELWLLHYGVAALFLLLALGIVGLPIPDETLIVLAGVLVAKGKLALLPTLFAIYLGAGTGITVSYLTGYTGGFYLITKIGKYIGITPSKITNAQKWYIDIGKWMLFFGYFIPGVRHLAGLIAGVMKLPYQQFALFAYSGLVVWASSVFLIGYSFHRNWQTKLSALSYVGICIGLLVLITIYLLFFFRRKKMISKTRS